MTQAAKSVYYFAFYLYLTGITLIFIPNVFLSMLGLPETNEVWIRVVGILALAIGFYYHQTAIQNNTAFFKLTVIVRSLVLVAFVLLVLLKLASPILIGIGLIDFIGAMWTRMALKKN
ncbi:MAG: hypothetical protein KA109_09665 [Saprospiraceae bacterium]|nr:hypothetical protein [Saprospiraceae bacterium]MBK7373082.1 hypothetical protein [Saprospiraceae bacterium]MBK7608953.1 hypothetical protein [Saprospiraceae bacterium]MBK8513214.1 hypothetical protein [Saprospiraceae bacterium]MBP7801874.1 hypothetical protein [Saprospiraceae bacterium]